MDWDLYRGGCRGSYVLWSQSIVYEDPIVCECGRSGVSHPVDVMVSEEFYDHPVVVKDSESPPGTRYGCILT